MKKRKVLLVYGPFDRYNYGDLLFPHIIKNEIGREYDNIEFFGIVKSDLSIVGGVKTGSFKDLYRLNKINYYDLIVAGGESLVVTWGTLCSYLYYWYQKTRIIWRVSNKIFFKDKSLFLENKLAQFLMKGETELPFCVNKSDFENISNVFYNSLGGSSLDDSKLKLFRNILSTLKDVDYLSVRDEKTYNFLRNKEISLSLVPDSAILMAKHFPLHKLRLKVSPSVLSFVEKKGEYCFFQVNKRIGLQKQEGIVNQLEMINDKLDICLCPIGLALGHEDNIALSAISKELSFEHMLFEDVTIWDIMFLIANARIYIGTSLHGAITAMSFNIPYLGFEVRKLEIYLKTWAPEGLNTLTSIDYIFQSMIERIVFSKEELKENADFQSRIVEASFKKMLLLT